MKCSHTFIACILGLLLVHHADGHGTPIIVTLNGSEMLAAGGLSDDEGFAPQIFVEADEDGDPSGSLTRPGVGPVILWSTPGFNISGLNNSSSLSIEVLSRPVKDSIPLEERVVWYWNPQLEQVAPATADLHLLGTGARFTTLSADSSEPPPAFLLASSLTGQQNSHNHGLLSYGLDNDTPPPAGAYGFFARLVSNQYEASNPFLITFNHGVDYELMTQAALAINAAAVDIPSLPGDFNFDGSVDAADYVVWRKDSAAPGDYQLWRNHFGAVLTPGSGGTSAARSSVPEPSLPTAAFSAILVAIRRRRWHRVR